MEEEETTLLCNVNSSNLTRLKVPKNKGVT